MSTYARHRKRWWSVTAALALGMLALAVPAGGGVVEAQGRQVFEAAGPERGSIQQAVDNFRNALGSNRGVGGSFPDGRREINWDGVPDEFSAPNLLPPNFFNANSPRGAVFFTLGEGFQVSADRDNPTHTPIEFGNLDPTFPRLFRTFSPERLFTALESPIVEVLFFVPGTRTPATTQGFGAVFTDVDARGTTKIECFSVNGVRLFRQHVQPVPGQDETLSFLGVVFSDPRIYMVRITSGTVPLSADPATRPNFAADSEALEDSVPSASLGSVKVTDRVVMDDFIYGEPQPLR